MIIVKGCKYSGFNRVVAAACLLMIAGCSPAPSADTPLQWLKLAKHLPAWATNVRVYEGDSSTWTKYYVSFQAPPQAIHAFLVASPEIKRATPEHFTPSFQLLPSSSTYDPLKATGWHDDSYNRTNAPWFTPTIKGYGRRYKITSGDNYGEVIINDDTHTVYIDASNG